MKALLVGISAVNRIASAVAGALTGMICIIVCYGVVVRYLLNRPVGWSEELSSYLIVWAAFLGAAYTLQRDGHIGVDVICRRFSALSQRRLHIAKYAVGTGFCALLAWKGYESCALSWMLGRVSVGDLQIPLYLPQMAVPVGACLLGLQMFEKMMGHVLSPGREEAANP
jgi:TRAP-type C4-dicarboxylate transport system permease small subunit